MKFVNLFLLSVMLTGCGTIDTVFRDNRVTSQKLAHWQSHCDSVPRVYSGAVLDFCALHAPPWQQTGLEGQPSTSLMLLDLLLSAVSDTLVLPYTIYLQDRDGSIPKSRLQ